jgi:hypothetical protein
LLGHCAALLPSGSYLVQWFVIGATDIWLSFDFAKVIKFLPAVPGGPRVSKTTRQKGKKEKTRWGAHSKQRIKY